MHLFFHWICRHRCMPVRILIRSGILPKDAEIYSFSSYHSYRKYMVALYWFINVECEKPFLRQRSSMLNLFSFLLAHKQKLFPLDMFGIPSIHSEPRAIDISTNKTTNARIVVQLCAHLHVRSSKYQLILIKWRSFFHE